MTGGGMFLTSLKGIYWPLNESTFPSSKWILQGLGCPSLVPAHTLGKAQYEVLLHTTLLSVSLQEEYSLENGLVPEI